MKRIIDWERVELDYRAGVSTLREIGANCGVSPAMIIKRAKKDGWDRDLEAKIKAKAEAAVNAAAVNAEVNKANSVYRAASERETIEANAAAIVSVRLRHRSSVKRASEQSDKLLSYLESTDIDGENAREFAGTLKQLADTQKSLITLEREAWGLAATPDKPQDADQPIDPIEGARRLAFVLARADQQLQQVH